MSLDRMLKELRASCGSHAAAVVSRDGLVIAGDMPDSISRETFAIMCATMLGAASTVNNELKGDEPEFMTVKSSGFETFLSGVTKDLLVVLIVPSSAVRAEAVEFLRSLQKLH